MRKCKETADGPGPIVPISILKMFSYRLNEELKLTHNKWFRQCSNYDRKI